MGCRKQSRRELFADTDEARRAVMSRIRSADTSLEARASALLADLPLPTATSQPADLPGKPDFAWIEQQVALFVHSCFWHGCPEHSRAPKSRLQYWLPKIEGNRTRDKAVARDLRSLGWAVVIVWEHDLRPDAIEHTRRNLRRRLRRLLSRKSDS